jgi:flagellar biosynthesis protein FlhB
MTEKRFSPSAERIRKARRDGKTVKSQLLTLSVSLLCIIALLSLSVVWFRAGTLIHWFNYKVLLSGDAITAAAFDALKITAAVLVPVMVAAVCSHTLQTRQMFCSAAALRGFHRLNPRAFLTRASDSAKDAPLGVVRSLMIMIVAAPVLWTYAQSSALLLSANQEQLFSAVMGGLKDALVRATTVVLVLGLSAYGFAYRRDRRSLMMTLEEVRQEQREDQGDPHLRSFRRAEAEMTSLADLERRVKQAQVVVVRRL